MATAIATFLHSIDGGGVGQGIHQPVSNSHHHPLAYIHHVLVSSSSSSSNSSSSSSITTTIHPHLNIIPDGGGGGGGSGGGGGGGLMDGDSIDAGNETDLPTHQHHDPQAVVDIIAVFGAIFLAGVAIILITVYISKLRKRQSSQLSSSLDIEMADCSVNSAPGHTTDPSASPSSLSGKEQVSEDEYHESDFGHKPSLWRKTIRSVLLRLRGEQQHKDVYVMPQHLRAQLKQMYVY